MSKMNVKLAAQRSPEREELAAAIAANLEAQRSAEAARAAVALAKKIVADVMEKREAARGALAAAKESHSARIAVAASAGEALNPDSAIREARARELEAADELESARSALATLEAALGDPEATHRRAQTRVSKATEAVVFSQVDAKFAEIREAQNTLGEKRLVLEFMMHYLDHFADGRREMRSKIDSFMFNISPFPVNGFGQWKTHPATQAWREAVDALMRDADTELPK